MERRARRRARLLVAHRYADVRAAALHQRLSSAEGTQLAERRVEGKLHSLHDMDEPRHGKLRRVGIGYLRAVKIKEWQAAIDEAITGSSTWWSARVRSSSCTPCRRAEYVTDEADRETARENLFGHSRELSAARRAAGSVGRAADGGVRIADPDGRSLGVDEVGAVWFVRARTAEPVRAADGSADLAATPGWGTVGDLGRVDADGCLYLTGRSSRLIITGGVNVHPREVEDLLALHPAVADVAVLGVPDEEYGERVVAAVQPSDGVAGGPAQAAELIAYCRSLLAHVKCPRSVDFVERIPRSDAGKIILST